MDPRDNQNNPLLHNPKRSNVHEKNLNFVARIKSSYERSSSFVEFLGRCSIILFETVGWILIVLTLGIPISMITVGTVYLRECPREHYIPIYLIVNGCFGVVKNVLNLIQSWVHGCGKNPKEEVRTNPLAVVLSWFLLAWFITGSVWIYRIYNDFSTADSTKANYCNERLYQYAFWVTTAQYAFTALACFGFCAVTSLLLSFDSDANKTSLMSCFGNILWILYWYFTRYEAVMWPGFKYKGGTNSRQRLLASPLSAEIESPA